MSYKLAVTDFFEKHARRLVKKYPSLKEELLALYYTLQETPTQGDELGRSCYKIRVAIKSKGKGKRGGARVITHVYMSWERPYIFSTSTIRARKRPFPKKNWKRCSRLSVDV